MRWRGITVNQISFKSVSNNFRGYTWLQSGKLQIVLEEWSPPSPGLALYYPGHRHVPAALSAFIEVLKSPVTAFPAE